MILCIIYHIEQSKSVHENRQTAYTVALHGDYNVYNPLQSGFNLEFYSGRRLAFRGEKHVAATVQSIPATIHIYAIHLRENSSPSCILC